MPIDYESLKKSVSIMGSGGMIVMDENTCMVDIARYYTAFLNDESCGKCLSCREGTRKRLNILTDISEGRGREGDIELLEELAQAVKDVSLCGLGQTAGNPVLASIRYFREEYEEHVNQHKCSAGVCQFTEVPVMELIEELPRRIQASKAASGPVETALKRPPDKAQRSSPAPKIQASKG